MTARYKAELGLLNNAYQSALKADIAVLNDVLVEWLDCSMIMLGSGGSFSTANFAAFLHQQHTGQIAKALTPLEFISSNISSTGMSCFTASGRNRDIGAAFKMAAMRELSPLSALVTAKGTPLHDIAERFKYSNVVGFEDEHFKDGFLAVASLLTSAVLLVRSYSELADSSDKLPNSISGLMAETVLSYRVEDIAEASEALLRRPNTSLLYSGALQPASVDLESRFVEASLGALHVADFRNFGHGRHFWLSHRGEDTGVIALVGSDTETLADRTLQLLPPDIPQLRIDFAGPEAWQALAGLVAGLYISEGAGRAAGVDPGKPGVPDFGRRLYRLGPGPLKVRQVDANRDAALKRKGFMPSTMSASTLASWDSAYQAALKQINNATISGIAFDYDGTLCDHRERFGPIGAEIASALTQIVESGAVIGIATGRGPSAGDALRAGLPKSVWKLVTMGYYNGAVITDLADERDPVTDTLPNDDALGLALRNDPLFGGQRVSANVHQISIGVASSQNISQAIGAATRHAALTRQTELDVAASSHSIDILLSGQSKLDLVDDLARRAEVSADQILRIGDRGVWPGNDAVFLDHILGLSVDESSAHRDHCWGLAPAGVKGMQATLFYLNRLTWEGAHGRLKLSGRERGGSK